MSRQSLKTKEAQEAAARLAAWIPTKGATIYTNQKHRSRSGLRRIVQFMVIAPDGAGKPNLFFIGYSIAQALGWRYDREREGVILAPGDDLVPELGRLLFGDSSALTERWT